MAGLVRRAGNKMIDQTTVLFSELSVQWDNHSTICCGLCLWVNPFSLPGSFPPGSKVPEQCFSHLSRGKTQIGRCLFQSTYLRGFRSRRECWLARLVLTQAPAMSVWRTLPRGHFPSASIWIYPFGTLAASGALSGSYRLQFSFEFPSCLLFWETGWHQE